MNDRDVKDYASYILERLKEMFVGTSHMKKKHLLAWMPITFATMQPVAKLEDVGEYESVMHLELCGNHYHYNLAWDYSEMGWTVRSLSSTG